MLLWSKKFPGNWQRQYHSRNFLLMKSNFRHWQKTIFSIKKYLPTQSMISSRSENFEHPWWRSRFSIELSWQYNTSWRAGFFKLIVSHFSAHYQRSTLCLKKTEYMLSKTIECLSMSLVAHKEGGFFFLFYLLFGVVFGSFQSFLACYGFFWVIPPFTTNNIIECFDWPSYYKSTLCRFYCTVFMGSLFYITKKS